MHTGQEGPCPWLGTNALNPSPEVFRNPAPRLVDSLPAQPTHSWEGQNNQNNVDNEDIRRYDDRR